ncbi:MAG TPA: hypothetical protein VFM15_01195, partial [Gammaproteobacteria bacterium]|nr:hypothetical protein [Gammaproteobacteria bacterium]
MPQTERTESALILPRPLVNQLLRAAQAAPAGLHWGLVTMRGSTPMYCRPLSQLDATVITAAREDLARQGENPFALYCLSQNQNDPPDVAGPETLAAISLPYLLHVCLGTRGVLQLRAWRLASSSV